MRKFFAAGLVVTTVALALMFAYSRVFGQPARSADPIFGRWMMDQTRSVNNRGGDHATFPTQHVRVLAREGDGLRNTMANSPTAAPQYSYAASFDGKAGLAFDSLGAPYSVATDGTTAALVAQGQIKVTAGTYTLTVTVEPYTGEINVQ